MKIIKTSPGCHLFLGHKGEKLALQIVFDIGSWIETYGPGTAHLLHQRKGDSEPYPVGTVQEGEQVFWNVSDSDTAVEGAGHYELHFYTGESLVKSVTGDTLVTASLAYGTEPPEPVQLWLDHVAEEEHKLYQAVTDAKEFSATAKESSVNAQVSEQNASLFEQSAATHELGARNAADAAVMASNKAVQSEQNSKTSEQNAAASAEEAKIAAENSNTSATNAEQSARNAKASETNLSKAEQNAKASADAAAASAQNAISYQNSSAQNASVAVKSADTAVMASSNAAKHAENAKKSAEEAKEAAENAKTSETNAAGSENAAKLSEANAKRSETNAGKHMSRASGYETSAYTYARNAGDSAKNAATSEANAKISEQNAEVFAESAAESAKRLGDAVVLAEIPHPDPENIGKAIIVNEDGTGFVFGESGSGEAIDTGALFGLTEKKTEVLPETGVSFSGGSRQKMYSNTPDDVQFPLEELYLGDYLVYWRGVPYECAVQQSIATGQMGETQRCITLGNVFGISHHTTITGIDMSVNSGEPFLIVAMFVTYPEGKTSAITIYRFDDTETAESIPVQIFLCEKEPNKMPTSYLPDGVPCHIDGMGEILSDYTIATEEDMTGIPRLNLVTGNTYIVKIKGVAEYTCVAFASELEGIPLVGIGNAMPFGGEDTGEPFSIAEVPPEVAAQMGTNVAIVPLTDELPDPLIFSIWGDIKEVRKLHADCLPDDATVFYLTSSNGTKFAITVDDSGTITATEV